MSVLISGSTGFAGRNLMKYLKDNIGNDEILPLDLRGSWRGSIDNETTAIIHLAGKAHDLKNAANPDEYYKVNYELTKDLYDAFLQSNAKQFIFISSVKAAADTVTGILNETMVPQPDTHYGKSKLMAEEYILYQALPKGKSYFILRPCMIHGLGNKGNLNLLYQVVKRGVPYPLAGFDNKRSFLSINNLCFIITELIARNDISSGIYNIADDEALSTNEVVNILSASLGRKGKLWHISPLFIKFIAKIGDKLHLPLTTERLNKLTESYVVSNEKIKAALQKPLPLSAREGLNITALSFKNS